MATAEAIGHARGLHASAREAHREEARQRKRARAYYDELKEWCRDHGITVEEYDPATLRKDGDNDGHGPREGTRN